MCEPASFVVIREGGQWIPLWSPDCTESHEDIIQYFNLPQDDPLRDITLVRTEILPPVKSSCPLEKDYHAPPDKWLFKTDQDLLPSWWDAGRGEEICRKAFHAWMSAKILRTGKREINNGTLIVLNDAVGLAYGKATLHLYDKSTGGAYEEVEFLVADNAYIRAFNSARGVIQNNAKGELYGHCFATVTDNAEVRMYDATSADAADSAKIYTTSWQTHVTTHGSAVVVKRVLR